jgi:FPC/CPF motif-containing protein YcgG
VSWSSKKQNYVALSTTEAEYVAASAYCAQLLWMRQTIHDFGCHFTKISLLYDNESTIKLANNPVSHSTMKHIDNRHHFLRDHETKGDIKIRYKQLADIFTKPLDKTRFYALHSELNKLDSRNVIDQLVSRQKSYEISYCASKWFRKSNLCTMIMVCIVYLLLVMIYR